MARMSKVFCPVSFKNESPIHAPIHGTEVPAFVGLGIYSGLCACKAVLYHLSHSFSPFLFWLFWIWGSQEPFAWADLEPQCLLISASQIAGMLQVWASDSRLKDSFVLTDISSHYDLVSEKQESIWKGLDIRVYLVLLLSSYLYFH
jgi:hypothetical protein